MSTVSSLFHLVHLSIGDLTSIDYSLWEYLKYFVYTAKPASIAALKANMKHVISEIPAEMCEKVT